MNRSSVLIAGCGYVGLALGRRLQAAGNEVWGLRRTSLKSDPGFPVLHGDLTRPEFLPAWPHRFRHVVYSASAGGDESAYRGVYVDGLRNLLDSLEEATGGPERVLFASSTGVYGQRRGEWVDETSSTRPTHPTGRILLEAEKELRKRPLTGIVVRLAGIYGPGRDRLLRRVREGRAVCAEGPPRYTNRIHREDCAGVLAHLLVHPDPDDLYLAVDHEPVERCRLLRWLARRLEVPPPPVVKETHTGGRVGRGNKRCRNDRLVATGYRFLYPTFREGYSKLIYASARPPRTDGSTDR